MYCEFCYGAGFQMLNHQVTTSQHVERERAYDTVSEFCFTFFKSNHYRNAFCGLGDEVKKEVCA